MIYFKHDEELTHSQTAPSSKWNKVELGPMVFKVYFDYFVNLISLLIIHGLEMLVAVYPNTYAPQFKR